MSKIMRVFYDNAGLPYKDRALSIHYPILEGGEFVGANNTTDIYFYTENLGDFYFVANCKLPNGALVDKLLIAGSDEFGTYYALSLDSELTENKGHLKVALKGYGGNVSIEEESDGETTIVVINGTPTIVATGIVDIAINYAPLVHHISTLTPSEYEELLAVIGTKLNIVNGIYVIDETSDANLDLEGEIYYVEETKEFYKVVSGVLEKEFFDCILTSNSLTGTLDSTQVAMLSNPQGYFVINNVIYTKAENNLYVSAEVILTTISQTSQLSQRQLTITNNNGVYTYNATTRLLTTFYNKDQADALLNSKVSKSGSSNIVYGRDDTQEVVYPIDDFVDGTVVRRNNNGNIYTPLPQATSDATPRQYVDGFAKSLLASINTTTYVMTLTLKDANGNTLGTPQTIDLPLESLIVSGSYDENTQSIILVTKDSQTISIPVGDLVAGLVSTTDLNTALALKQDTLVSGTNIKTINNQSILGSGNIDVGGGDYAQFTILLNNDNCNLFNPLTAEDNVGLKTADGTEVENASAYSSDYIDIEGAKHIFCSHTVSKLCLYDSSYNFISTKTPSNNIAFNLTAESGFKYCRVMIEKTSLTYANRYMFSLAQSQYFDYPYAYKHISYNGIGNNEINLRKLDKGLKSGIILENIKLNNNPLSYKDFQLGNLVTSTGEFGSNVNVIASRDLLFLPKGTKISFTSSYESTIFEYNKNDTAFFGRYKGTGWFNPMIVPSDGYYRIIVHKTSSATISYNEIKTIIDNMSIEYTYLENKLSYDGKSIELKTNRLSYIEQSFNNYGQDSAQWGNKVFSFNNTGQFKVYDLETKQEFTGFQLDQYATIKPHCNCVCFSNQYYSTNDTFPLLYVNAYNTANLPKGTCYVHRITKNGNTYSTTLIQTINIGFTSDEVWTVEGDTRDYGNFLVDTDKNQLIVYTLRNNKTRFFIFNLPNISLSQVTLQTTDILDYFDCDFFNYIQGGYYNDGKVYSLDGIGTQSNPIGYLHVFDLEKKELVTSVDISSLMYEPESIFEYQGNLFIAQNTFYELIFK